MMAGDTDHVWTLSDMSVKRGNTSPARVVRYLSTVETVRVDSLFPPSFYRISYRVRFPFDTFLLTIQGYVRSPLTPLTLLGLHFRFGDNWGQLTWILRGLSPKRDWSPKRVKRENGVTLATASESRTKCTSTCMKRVVFFFQKIKEKKCFFLPPIL